MRKRNKIIAVTAGDPAGIGPEITAKSLIALSGAANSGMLVIGRFKDFSVWDSGKLDISWHAKAEDAIESLNEHEFAGLSLTELENLNVEIGKPTAESGEIAYKSIEQAVELCKASFTQGLATAPIAKDALKYAGYKYTGHTTIFKEMLDVEPVMTFYTPLNKEDYRKAVLVSLVSMHIPLMQASQNLSPEKLEYVVKVAIDAIKNYLGNESPRIAVSGMNPHAGEGGMFGNEEVGIINPVIEKLQNEGINIVGALAPDTIFYRAFLKREFDCVIALYHDQGLIAVKTFDFLNSVQMTLGLPFLRTSVDHGTAFDIAGKGIADINSMMNALKLADKLI